MSCGKWSWNRDQPWPPLKTVLACKLWSDPLYQPLRDTLVKPLIEPVIELGSEYITIHCLPKPTPPVAPVEPTPPDEPVSVIEEEEEIEEEELFSAERPKSKPSTSTPLAQSSVPSGQRAPPTEHSVLHIMPFAPGCPVPADILAMPLQCAFFEVDPTVPIIHTYLNRLICQGVPLVLIGSVLDNDSMVQSIRNLLQQENLYTPTIEVYSPGPEAPSPYSHCRSRITIVQRPPLVVKVLADCVYVILVIAMHPQRMNHSQCMRPFGHGFPSGNPWQ